MTEEQRPERNIADELSKLGKQMADAIKGGWESEDRVRLQSEISEGLQKLGDEVGEAMRRASSSETAQHLRTQAEKVVEDVRESDVTAEIRKGLLAGLESLNRELGKLLAKLENRQDATPAEPQGAESAESPIPVGETDETAETADQA